LAFVSTQLFLDIQTHSRHEYTFSTRTGEAAFRNPVWNSGIEEKMLVIPIRESRRPKRGCAQGPA
jgi:hypothetical protein